MSQLQIKTVVRLAFMLGIYNMADLSLFMKVEKVENNLDLLSKLFNQVKEVYSL